MEPSRFAVALLNYCVILVNGHECPVIQRDDETAFKKRLRAELLESSRMISIDNCEGPLGGPLMQYHLRQCLIFLDAFTFGKPEIFIGTAQNKCDPEKGVLTDEATRNIIKQQLAGFAKFIVKMS